MSLAAVGAIEPLVELLRAETALETARMAAARAEHVPNTTPVYPAPVAPAESTCGALPSEVVYLPCELVCALWNLGASNPANQAAIAECGAVPLLIALLSVSGAAEDRRNALMTSQSAAGALWALATAHEANQRRIAEEGGLAPLISLLSAPGALVGEGSAVAALTRGAQETAAGALHALAALPENRVRIAEAGAIPPLAALFESGTEVAKAEAAASLAALVVHNSANQGAVAHALVSMLRYDLEGGRLTPLIASDCTGSPEHSTPDCTGVHTECI